MIKPKFKVTLKPKHAANAAKYRPVLTAKQIVHILTLAKTELPLTAESMSVISTLSPFLAKIENAGIQAAYDMQDPKPKVNSLESLGGGGTSTVLLEHTEDKELYWQRCYKKYKEDPASCSLEEIQGAQEHKYLTGLMSKEEEKAFELAEEV